MPKTIEEFRARQDELLAANQDVLAQASAGNRELTKQERDDIKANEVEFDRIEDEIRIREGQQAREALLNKGQGRKTTPDGGDGEGGDGGENRPAAFQAARATPAARHSKTFGFRNLGEFCRATFDFRFSGSLDERLRAAAAGTISVEGVGADGGFAVPPEFRTAIMERVFSEDSLLARTDNIVSNSNSLTLPSDMTTPWDSTGGIQAYWTGEGAAINQSKVKLEEVTVKLHKLAVLCPVTEELIADAAALGSYIERKAAEKIDFKVSHAIMWGTGSGQPLGLMNAPCLVTQAGEGAQTADTINATNIVKMYGRMPAPNRRTAVWLIHPDAEAQLPLMTIGQQPVYMPPGGLSGALYGTLLGRPVIPHQVNETVGDLGDIAFVDLKSYLTVTKGGGVKSDTSLHFWFDQDITAAKFTFRMAGQPWWSAAVSQRDGSNTMSPFVTLAAR